jgi:hypothetical protein
MSPFFFGHICLGTWFGPRSAMQFPHEICEHVPWYEWLTAVTKNSYFTEKENRPSINAKGPVSTEINYEDPFIAAVKKMQVRLEKTENKQWHQIVSSPHFSIFKKENMV